MNSRSAVFTREGPVSPATSTGADVRGWSLLEPAGLLFLLVGSVDIAMGWYPLSFGRPEWEFATVTATFNGLPGPTMGLALLAASAVALRRVRTARVLAALFAILAVLVLAATVVYATNIPIAFDAVPATSAARAGLDKAIVKTLVQAALYSVVFVWMSIATWRRVRPVHLPK